MTAEQANELTHDVVDWIEWAGGPCPVEPRTLVQVQMRFEAERDETQQPRRAGAWPDHWERQGDEILDIIAYRVVSK